MVQINFAQKTVNVKIVYYGPGMSGKTTNLEIIHQRAPEGNHGDLTSISTDGDRTLFFDYMPLDLGTVAGMRTAFQLYTVPGQVYYNSTRKLVLQGVDGIIFVADSSASMLNQNLESLRNLEENLNEYGKSLATLPHVIQFNKRDLPDAMSVEELTSHLNPHDGLLFEATANTGQGVFPTLKALAASVLRNIMKESGGKKRRVPAAARPSAAAPAQAAPAHPQTPTAPAAPRAAIPGPAGAQPAYPPVGAPSAGQGGALFPTAQQPGVPAPAAQGNPNPQGGLQLAPSAAPGPQAQVRPRQAASPALQARPAAAQPRRPQRAPAAPNARTRAAAPRARQAQPKSSGGKLTPIFILAGAGAGAVLAWVLMNVL